MKINVSSTENPNDTYSNTFTYGAPSSYSECLSDSVINKPNYTPMPYIIDGAFPCRWFFRHKDSSDFVSLKNGLFLNMQSVNLGLDTPYWSAIYTIRTLIEVNIQDGYIHIDFKQHSFIYSGGSQGCFNTDDRMTEGYKTQMWVQLSVGQYYWDGNNWSANAGSRFPIPFVNETITSNKTTDMHVDGNDGWFIPVTGLLSGYMRFSILGVMESGTDFIASHVYANSRIISDLDVSFLANNSLAASSRGSNVYRESIMSSGFSQDIAINSGIGTINNNLRSPSFIKSSTTEYIEQMTYYTGTNTTTTQRPELRLLARMVRYYGTVRRTFTGVVQRGLDVMLQRYMYICIFFGIRAKTNWRDDTEDVKFIEV